MKNKIIIAFIFIYLCATLYTGFFSEIPEPVKAGTTCNIKQFCEPNPGITEDIKNNIQKILEVKK